MCQRPFPQSFFFYAQISPGIIPRWSGYVELESIKNRMQSRVPVTESQILCYPGYK